ncbi:macrocin O-methyltransferase [Hoeflea sp. YIM 152468]|uniref:TylF/MycF/NovP-related O-methyltransferase n=1 Tax=Hoeflea sp. YIM 152468 TaxID=3031759 RepID=UPI0023DBC72B|nr:TylF/MycF/NovP-related O-methyltransferase [Hoeflea sp. YIM 152468]MDF1608325.1 macrocin O-methyltransferase [Hoeflea sp. YIM 152468]
MKRIDQRRIRLDDALSRLMQTEAGRAEYWRRLDAECDHSPLVELLDKSLDLEGDVIECGVFRGTSTRLIARRLTERSPTKKLFACDSFEGFPQDRIQSKDLNPLRFRFRHKIRRKFARAADVPFRLMQFFEAYRVNGYVVKGFFSDTLPKLVRRKFCFIFIDCDIYDSHLDCLNILYDQLVPGGLVMFDDYAQPKWPGASRAVDDFFASRPEKPQSFAGHHGTAWYVRKPLVLREAAPTPAFMPRLRQSA